MIAVSSFIFQFDIVKSSCNESLLLHICIEIKNEMSYKNGTYSDTTLYEI